MTEFVEVPFAELAPPSRNVRVFFRELDELQQSLAAQHVIEPLIVRRVERDGRQLYEVIAGERRFRALAKLAETQSVPPVPCLVRQVDGAELMLVQLAENSGRQRLTLYEIGRAVDELEALEGSFDAAPRVAAAIGKSASYVRSAVRVVRQCAPEIVAALSRAGELRDTALTSDRLFRWATLPVEQQRAEFEELCNTTSSKKTAAPRFRVRRKQVQRILDTISSLEQQSPNDPQWSRARQVLRHLVFQDPLPPELRRRADTLPTSPPAAVTPDACAAGLEQTRRRPPPRRASKTPLQ